MTVGRDGKQYISNSAMNNERECKKRSRLHIIPDSSGCALLFDRSRSVICVAGASPISGMYVGTCTVEDTTYSHE